MNHRDHLATAHLAFYFFPFPLHRRAIWQQDGCAPAMAGRRRMSSTTGSPLLRGRWSKIPLHHPASDMSYVRGM